MSDLALAIALITAAAALAVWLALLPRRSHDPSTPQLLLHRRAGRRLSLPRLHLPRLQRVRPARA